MSLARLANSIEKESFMKTYLLMLALVLGVTSCQRNNNELEAGQPYYDERDCTSPLTVGADHGFENYVGTNFPAKVLPHGQFHRLRVVKEPNPNRPAYMTFTANGSGWLACLDRDRLYNQGSADHIFIYAGNGCFHPPQGREIKSCPTKYGYLFMPANLDGQFGTVAVFITGPVPHDAAEENDARGTEQITESNRQQ
jgi:hypothetical protein